MRGIIEQTTTEMLEILNDITAISNKLDRLRLDLKTIEETKLEARKKKREEPENENPCYSCDYCDMVSCYSCVFNGGGEDE